MAKTAEMKLIELMILKQDIDSVLEFLGKKGNFQFQNLPTEKLHDTQNPSQELFEKLKEVKNYLQIQNKPEFEQMQEQSTCPTEQDFDNANKILADTEDIKQREIALLAEQKKVNETYTEALAFANLKANYGDLEHLSFLSFRIGKIDPANLEQLQFACGDRAIIVPLGEDKTRILAASSKKGRFALDSELKRFGFVAMEIPSDFKGIPDEMIDSLKQNLQKLSADVASIQEERKNYADTHADLLQKILGNLNIANQIHNIKERLEATQLVYRITGWIEAKDSDTVLKDLDNLTQGRIAIREYAPDEVPSIKSGSEKVPVKLEHGKFISSFERMIFSYGSPLYGTIDPTPFVAFFFTLLFGIMFGDLGQGLVFVLIGVAFTKHWVPLFKSWHKFGPVFIAIGCSSSIMGLLTGEFFCNEEILEPVGKFLTGLFVGKENAFAPILHMMPTADTIGRLFMFFLFTIGVGFIINSVGLVINIVNNFILKRYGKAIFGKTGICGTAFFWYIVVMVIRIFVFGHSIAVYDWVVIGLTLLGVFFAGPLERLVEGHRPVLENGLFPAIIEGIVELLEVVSSYLSNSVSFVRVGAFALAHAVLSYIINTMATMVPVAIGSLAVVIVGNAIVIVLEGMIVAIQVIRLQYYEFFSKFFTETGKEFIPFKFKYFE